MSEAAGERLQKVLAHAGIASRRAAEELIAVGRVAVNGEVVREMGRRVTSRDRIEVDGQPIGRAERLHYLAVNKPSGYISTARDPEGRPTVMELVRVPARVYPIGRLDWDTEGLLLMSNDGELAHRLTHPRYGIEKEYHALIDGYPPQRAVRALREGVELEDGWTAPAKIGRLREEDGGLWLAISIHEGRNRQVRRMIEAVGFAARRLVRVRMGPVRLGRLPPGQVRELARPEVDALREATGLPDPFERSERQR